jgi:hypothetical protein
MARQSQKRRNANDVLAELIKERDCGSLEECWRDLLGYWESRGGDKPLIDRVRGWVSGGLDRLDPETDHRFHQFCEQADTYQKALVFAECPRQAAPAKAALRELRHKSA